MDNYTSGSVPSILEECDFDLDEDIAYLMKSKQFEQDLIDSFTISMYSTSSKLPKPYWAYCSITHRMIRVMPKSEVVVINEHSYLMADKDDRIECLVGQNLIQIPKIYIDIGEWN